MKIGFVGAGNMGGAIVKGFAASGAAHGSDDAIFVYDSDGTKAVALAGDFTFVKTADSLTEIAGLCDTLVLCVKPNAMDEVLDTLAASADEDLSQGKLFISIAAGISIAHIKGKLGASARVVRVMPNTPAMVGEGMSVMSAHVDLSETDRATAERLFVAVGRTLWADEDLMDVVTGISGSSPAYAYLYIEGLVRAGMAGGLDKESATVLAAQSTLGAAKMVLANLGRVEPRQLCINVCSPGGTTIEAVKVLESADFTETVNKAAQASAAKSKLMTR